MIKLINVLLLFFVLSFPLGCERSISPPVITHFGNYQSPDNSKSLEIVRRDKSLVFFTLKKISDNTVLISDTIGSDAMRWCFYWDEFGSLWIYSSDTGYFKTISLLLSGQVSTIEVTKDTKMPKPIIDFLPSSLKRYWGLNDKNAEPGA